MAWYDNYFTADYWAYADAEYTAARTGAEVDYLVDVLRAHAPGSRVLDLGCGTGRHAVGLAQRGFEVVGVDASAFALGRAAAASADAGVRVELHQADLLGAPDWGVGPVDAVICVQAFGWGSDADQLRLLRAVRRLLPPGGLLVLDHSSILAITGNYQSHSAARIGDTMFEFSRAYDPVTGRSGGQVDVRRADGSQVVLPDDVRLYTPAEVAALLARAGFEVTGTDADFRAGAPVTIGTRYVQFLARPGQVIESALTGHRDPPPPDDVDLRWALDEADFAAPAIAAAWATVTADPLSLADLARRYDLADPFGGGRAAPVLAGHLGWPAGRGPSPDRVSVGAGVTGLLHGLARLADGGSVLIAPDGHPQLAEAVAATCGEVRVVAMTEAAVVTAAVAAIRPAVTVIDRPALTGPHWSLDMISELAASTQQAGGVLVVDETCGGYLPPGSSAAPLTDVTPGLIVLRGISKGFCCGGLRIGFAVVSPDLASRVRGVLAPLAASALALDVALELLRQPDPLGPLRVRIAEVKPRIQAALELAGLPALPTDSRVPWIVLADQQSTRTRLAACGLAVKEAPVLHPGGPMPSVLRMSVPLSAARYAAVESALAAATPPAGRRA